MTIGTPGHATIDRQRCQAFCVLLVGLSFFLFLLLAGWMGGFRVNTTPSQPLGLWRIRPVSAAIRPGQSVFVCLPTSHRVKEARQRGYLRHGSCPGGFAPLIKTVIAVGGQRVEVSDQLLVDGRPVSHSRLLNTDGKGRSLRKDSGGVVGPDMIYLHSPFAASWDSRYFGAVPISGILGLAQEVLTYAP